MVGPATSARDKCTALVRVSFEGMKKCGGASRVAQLVTDDLRRCRVAISFVLFKKKPKNFLEKFVMTIKLNPTKVKQL